MLLISNLEAHQMRGRSVDGLNQIFADIVRKLRVLLSKCRSDRRSLENDRLRNIFAKHPRLQKAKWFQVLLEQYIEIVSTRRLQLRVTNIHLVAVALGVESWRQVAEIRPCDTAPQ
jgi:hypothetical protein